MNIDTLIRFLAQILMSLSFQQLAVMKIFDIPATMDKVILEPRLDFLFGGRRRNIFIGGSQNGCCYIVLIVIQISAQTMLIEQFDKTSTVQTN